MLENFLVVFITLFVAVDIFAVVPFYLSLSLGRDEREKNMILIEAIITAFFIGIFFLFIGDFVLRLLGIGVSEFQISGGLILLIISIRDILFPQEPLRQVGVKVSGAVPLGTPLIVGPAVITALMVLVKSYGYIFTLIPFAINLIIAWIALRWATFFERVLGENILKAVAKVMNLILASFGVGMIKKGIMGLIK